MSVKEISWGLRFPRNSNSFEALDTSQLRYSSLWRSHSLVPARRASLIRIWCSVYGISDIHFKISDLLDPTRSQWNRSSFIHQENTSKINNEIVANLPKSGKSGRFKNNWGTKKSLSPMPSWWPKIPLEAQQKKNNLFLIYYEITYIQAFALWHLFEVQDATR